MKQNKQQIPPRDRHQSNGQSSPRRVDIAPTRVVSTKQYFSSPEAFRCGYCDRSFPQKDLLVRHLLSHIPTRSPTHGKTISFVAAPPPSRPTASSSSFGHPSFSNYQGAPSIPTPQGSTRAFYSKRGGDSTMYPVQYLSQHTEMIQYDPNKMKFDAQPFRVCSNQQMNPSQAMRFKVVPTMYAQRIPVQRVSMPSRSKSSSRSSSGTTTRGNVTPHTLTQCQLNPTRRPLAKASNVMGEPPQKRRKTSVTQNQVKQPTQVSTLQVHNVTQPDVATKPPPLEVQPESHTVQKSKEKKSVQSTASSKGIPVQSEEDVSVHKENQNQINTSNSTTPHEPSSNRQVIVLESKSPSPMVQPPELESKETQTVRGAKPNGYSTKNAMVATDSTTATVQSIATETDQSALCLSDFVNSVQYTPRPKTPKGQSVSVGIQINSVLVSEQESRESVLQEKHLENLQRDPTNLPSHLQDLESEGSAPHSESSASTADFEYEEANKKRISLRLLLKNRKLSDVVVVKSDSDSDSETATDVSPSTASSPVTEVNKEGRVKYKPKDIVWIKFCRHREPAIIAEVVYDKNTGSPKLYQCLWLNWKDATNEHGRRGLLSITSEPADKIQGMVTDNEIEKLFKEDRISEDGKDAIRKWRLELYKKCYDPPRTEIDKMIIESKAITQKV